MNKIVLGILFAVLSVFSVQSIGAQSLVIDPIELFAEAEGCWDEQIKEDFSLKNSTNDSLFFLWKVERIDVPDKWEVQVCDAVLCHEWGGEICPPEKTNVLVGGQEVNYSSFKIRTNDNVAGIGRFNLIFFNNLDSTDVYSSVPIEITATGCTSTTHDFDESKDLSIYPNPTTDFFKVSNAELVTGLRIYSIVGKEVENLVKNDSGLYDISNLINGMYIVRLYDLHGDLLKVLRISKN